MTRAFIIFIIFVCLGSSSFGQDSIFFIKRWQLQSGINIFIPIRNYHEEYGTDCFDCIYGKTKVKPRFTASSFFIDFNYRGILHQWDNSFLGTITGLGYKHIERKNEKEGYYGSEFIGNEGKITNISKTDFSFLNFALNHNFTIKQKVLITNQVDFGLDFSFHQYMKVVEYGLLDRKWSNNNWHIMDPLLNMNYELQATIQINNHFLFISRIEIPLLVVDPNIWGNSNFMNTPWSTTPYPNRINKISFIGFKTGIIYII